jgi:IclR family KDG regulon transcriptional repressor
MLTMNNSVANITTMKTVQKAMQLLHAFSNADPELSIGALSQRLDMHKSIVSRLVTALCEWRMLERDPVTKRVRLGLGALQLGMQVANHNPLHRLALPLLGALVERTRHTAHVSTRDGAEMLVIASVLSPSALRVTLQLGDRRPLHATAAGKILLAHLNDQERAEFAPEVGLRALTPQTITDTGTLADALDSIRATGIGWNEGESAPGVGSVASPVYDASSRVIGAVSSVFPLSQVKAADRTSLAENVRQTSRDLSAALGWQGQENIKRRK